MKIRRRLLTGFTLLLLPTGVLLGSVNRDFVPGLAASSPMPLLRHSHIAAWFDEPGDHVKYSEVNAIVQDLDITDEAEVPKWKAIVEQWHTEGKLFFAELRPATPLGHTFETLMDDPGLRAAACVDMNGEPLGPAWQAGRTYKGHPVQYFCSNHPRYRSFLRYLIYLYHVAGADGLFVDDAGGNPASQAGGGCLCPHCVARFRTFLGEKYSPEKWAKLNLGSLDQFDYKAVVRSVAKTRAEYRTKREQGKVPLADDFATFLRASDAELFIGLHAQMDKLSGRHVPMAWDNFNFSAARLPYYPTLDAFAPEISFAYFAPGVARGEDGDRAGGLRFPPSAVLLNRLSDGLGRWYSPIPAPPTWHAAKYNHLTGMLRLWVAATYANGGLPRYPRKGWAGIKDGVIDWYYPPKEAFTPLYAFVRQNPALLDGYEAIAQVAILYSEGSAGLNGAAPIKAVAESLVNANIPFTVVVAGETMIAQRLARADATRFEAILLPASTKIEPAQQAIVDDWKKQGRALAVAAKEDAAKLLAGKVDPLVALVAPADVRLFPRAKSGDKRAPVVCHLVNWNYDPSTNTTTPQKDVKIRLRSALTPGASVTRILYHTPEHTARELRLTGTRDGIQVTVPEVALWGVLEIQHK